MDKKQDPDVYYLQETHQIKRQHRLRVNRGKKTFHVHRTERKLG